MVAQFCLAVLLIGVTGCKYEVAAPAWNTPLVAGTAPVITQVSPAAATAGVNTITIQGANFAAYPDSNFVYFGQTKTDVVSYTSTSITVRRPNLVTGGCTIAVVPGTALSPAKSTTQYAVTNVVEKYGNFIGNLALSVVVVDSIENVYVLMTDSKKVVRVYPDGRRDTVGTVVRAVSDARIGPDGFLYLIGRTSRYIQGINIKVKPSPALVASYKNFWPGMACGDFDASGYFYGGGDAGNDVQIAAPNFTKVTASGMYPTEQILAVRVSNKYLYVAGSSPSGVTKIWRHAINGGGVLGSQELVIALDSTTRFSSRAVKSLTFSNGKMFVGTNAPDPLLVVDISSLPSKTVDMFYKGVLPSSIKHMNWGSGNYLYMINQDATANPAEDWNVYKIDMGHTVTP
jgi:hypothetical protein